jgi:hypothetical protein
MSFVPGTPNYANDESLTKLIQLIKNQFSTSLNGTIILRLTKAEYDAISPKSPNTVYYVTNVVTGEVECYLGDTKISGEGGGGDSEIYGIPFNGIMEWNSTVIEELYSSDTEYIVVNLKDYNLQNAVYSDSAGTLTPGGTQYPSTLDYIPLNGITAIRLTAYDTTNTGMLWCAYLYDSSKSYMYSETNNNNLLSWADNSTTRNIPTTATYIRFILRNSGRTAITPEGVREAWYNRRIVHYDPL